MHLFNLPIIAAITMIMTLSLSEELLLGISILILLSAFVYLLAEDIYDFSYNQRKAAAQKILISLQDLEKTILEYQIFSQQISSLTRSFQVLSIETFSAKTRSLQRRQNEFSSAISYIFDDLLATALIYERFQVEAYHQVKLSFWAALNK